MILTMIVLWWNILIKKYIVLCIYLYRGDEKGKIINCNFCSYSHNRGSCLAYTKTCNLCKKKGHFANCCKTSHKKIQEVRQESKSKQIDNTSSSDDDVNENLFVGVVFNDEKHDNPDLISF